jgi:transposase InsO family protein
MGTNDRRTYTAKERKEALESLRKAGVSATAEQNGVTPGSGSEGATEAEIQREIAVGTPRRKHSEEKRGAVLASVKTDGVNAAARKHGISQSRVSVWARDAGVKRESPAVSAEGIETKQSTPAKLPADEAVEKEPTPHGKLKKPVPPTRPTADGSLASQARAKPPRKPGSQPAKVYTPSQKAEILEAATGDGVSAAAKKHGASRFSIYAWQRKVNLAAAGQGPSPTSGPSPQRLEEQRDQEILAEYQTHPGLGPSQIRNQLRRRHVRVSVHTVRRVMEGAGYRPPKVERKKHDRRYEAVRPNHLWHLDFVQRFIGRSTTFTLILIDDCSRFVVGHGVDDAERADLVIATFEEAVRRHGRPESVMHDKGSAFWSWRGISRFTALLAEMGIDQIVAEHKEVNGKVENFNGNLHKELFDVKRFADVAEMRRCLAAHLSFYNRGRTHQALGGLLVPADRYYGRAEEVMARIEAGGGGELGDGFELQDRCLELFKVQSRGGVPEVWLLGRKLLGLADSAGEIQK